MDHSDKVFLGSTAVSLILSALFSLIVSMIIFTSADVKQVMIDIITSMFILTTNGVMGYWMGIKLVNGIKKPILQMRFNHLVRFKEREVKENETTN